MTNSSVHGHEVIHMMVESGLTYTKDTLRDAIIGKFGAETTFHTCSAEGLSADGLIDFLDSRGKLMKVPGGFVFGAGDPCGHN